LGWGWRGPGWARGFTSLKEKLIKIGAKVVSHSRYVAFQMAEVAIPRQMFQEILRLVRVSDRRLGYVAR
jgi:hypothetical protein